MTQWMLAICFLVPLLFLKLAWTSGSSQFTYYWSLAWRILSITSVWDECNCAVVWTFFALPFFGIEMKTDLFQSCGHCWVFQICWHIECSTFTTSSSPIYSSSFLYTVEFDLLIICNGFSYLHSWELLVWISLFCKSLLLLSVNTDLIKWVGTCSLLPYFLKVCIRLLSIS